MECPVVIIGKKGLYLDLRRLCIEVVEKDVD
jgi:hypothetical protein